MNFRVPQPRVSFLGLVGWVSAWLVVPVLLGAGMGALVVFDPDLSRDHPLWEFLRSRSLPAVTLWSATALAVLGVILLVTRSAGWWFRHRDAIATGLLMSVGAINGVNVGPLDAFEFAFLLTLAYWLAVSLVEFRSVAVPRLVLAALGGFSICTVASVINGRVTSLFGLHTLFSKFLMIVLVCSFAIRPQLFQVAVRSFIYVAVSTAVVAVLALGLNLTTGFALTFVDTPAEQFKSTPFGYLLRASAFCQTPQALGHLCVMALCLVFQSPWRAGWRYALALTLLVGIGLTWSTGAILTAGVVTLLFPLVRWPHHVMLYLALLAVSGFALYFSGIAELIFDKVLVPLGSAGVEDRVGYLKVGLEKIQVYPWLGAGVKNTSRLFSHPIHNTYFMIISELGIAAGVLLFLLIAGLAIRCASLARRAADENTRHWLKALGFGAAGMGIHFLSEPLYYSVLPWVFLGLVSCGVSVMARFGTLEGTRA